MTERNHFVSVSCEDNIGRLDDRVLKFVTEKAEKPLLLRFLSWCVEGLADGICSALVKGYESSKITPHLQDPTIFVKGFYDCTGSQAIGINACIAAEDDRGASLVAKLVLDERLTVLQVC